MPIRFLHNNPLMNFFYSVRSNRLTIYRFDEAYSSIWVNVRSDSCLTTPSPVTKSLTATKFFLYKIYSVIEDSYQAVGHVIVAIYLELLTFRSFAWPTTLNPLPIDTRKCVWIILFRPRPQQFRDIKIKSGICVSTFIIWRSVYCG